MFPPVIGLLALMAMLAIVGLGLAAIVLGMTRGTPRTGRIGRWMVAGAVVAYAAIWLIGTVGAPAERLPLGQEVSFCGLDCHLHVSVVKVDRAGDIGVTIRFRSDAKAAPDYPGLLRFEVVDSMGRRYSPSSGLIAEPLLAGTTIEREFRFALPAGVEAAGLTMSFSGWMDYLVPGSANPVAQRKVVMAL